MLCCVVHTAATLWVFVVLELNHLSTGCSGSADNIHFSYAAIAKKIAGS